MKSIAVITFAMKSRKELLLKCIDSVKNQLTDCEIKQYIFYKDEQVVEYLDKNIGIDCGIKTIKYDEINIPYISMKMAILRNMAMKYVDEDYLCFLDDDNEINPLHIQSLISLIINNKVEAAHSWRYLVHDDNSLFDGSYYPWHNKNDSKTKSLIHSWCVDNRLIIPGSPVLRDRYIEDENHLNISNIDMNEWLFSTSMIKSIQFDEDFSQSDQENELAEDFKLLLRLKNNNITYICSGLASVKYRLGGFSNNVSS